MSDYQNFEDRHIGPSVAQESEMLSVLGYSDIKSFISDAVSYTHLTLPTKRIV